MSKTLIVPCPTCKTLVERSNENFPFCSARCKGIDLGNWASDSYSIKGESAMSLDNLEMDDEYKNIH